MAKNNIVSFGLRNVHYSKATQADDGTWSFATPVALPGAQEFNSDGIQIKVRYTFHQINIELITGQCLFCT